MFEDLISGGLIQDDDSDIDLLDPEVGATFEPSFDLDSVEDTDESEDEGLGATRTRRRRRRRKGRRAKARRRKSRRPRRRKARARRAAPKRRRRRRRKVAVAAPKRRRRRRRKTSSKRRRRSRLGGTLKDLVRLSSLGAPKRRRRRRKATSKRRRRRARVAAPRRRRKSSRRRRPRARRRRRSSKRRRRTRSRSRVAGFGSLANMANALGAAEVKKSTPVIGAFQWMATKGGLEALGGVGLAGLVGGVVSKGLFKNLLNRDPDAPDQMLMKVASGLTSTVVMWELGRLLGSGGVAKFGAMYSIGRLIEDLVTKKHILKNIPGLDGYGYMGQLRIPDEQDLVGMGQLRIPDEQDLVGMGQLRVPEGTPFSEDTVAEEELLGQFENELDEESDLF